MTKNNDPKKQNITEPKNLSEIIEEFEYLWGNYPRSKDFSGQGLDHLIKKFISDSFTSLVEQAKQELDELFTTPSFSSDIWNLKGDDKRKIADCLDKILL